MGKPWFEPETAEQKKARLRKAYDDAQKEQTAQAQDLYDAYTMQLTGAPDRSPILGKVKQWFNEMQLQSAQMDLNNARAEAGVRPPATNIRERDKYLAQQFESEQKRRAGYPEDTNIPLGPPWTNIIP